jgi:predicted small lipoprotein YifL
MQRSDWYFLITLATLLVLSLTGCSRKTPVEQAFQGVDERITAIDRALTPECRTEDVMRTIDAVRHEVMVARVSCETKIEEYKTKYKMTSGILFAIILLIIGRFAIKRI